MYHDASVSIFRDASLKTGEGGIRRAIWTRHFDAKVFHAGEEFQLGCDAVTAISPGDGYLQCWLKQHT